MCIHLGWDPCLPGSFKGIILQPRNTRTFGYILRFRLTATSSTYICKLVHKLGLCSDSNNSAWQIVRLPLASTVRILVIMCSLYDVHEMNSYTGLVTFVSLSVRVFPLENSRSDFNETGIMQPEVNLKLLDMFLYKCLHSVILTWRNHEFLRWTRC
jgi:hypothetical protein